MPSIQAELYPLTLELFSLMGTEGHGAPMLAAVNEVAAGWCNSAMYMAAPTCPAVLPVCSQSLLWPSLGLALQCRWKVMPSWQKHAAQPVAMHLGCTCL